MTDTTAGEGVIRRALGQIVDLCPATCETSLAHEMADIAREALAALSKPNAQGREG